MYCSNCGNELVDGAAFCSACGAKVGGGSPSTTSDASSENTLRAFIEGLTVDQCSIEQNEEGVYEVYWKDSIHSEKLDGAEIDFGEIHQVEEFSLSATDEVVSDIYNLACEYARNSPDFQGQVLLVDLEDMDAIFVAHNNKADFPVYAIFAKSYVSQDFSVAMNEVNVQRIEGFRMGKKKGRMSSLAGAAFNIAREHNEKAANWGEAFDMMKGLKKEMRGSKYQEWADSVHKLVCYALSPDVFNADVERSANYLTGDLNS